MPKPNISRELTSAPLPEMVKGLGIGIAEAQYALDQVSMNLAKEMVETKVDFGGTEYSLLALGFTPTFYQFVDTLIEVKMSFSTMQSREIGGEVSAKGGVWFASASVSGSYAQKYQYSAEGSSLIKTKIVSIPAPSIFNQRLQNLIELELEDIRAASSSS